jgi:hypothetical protein
LTGNGWQLGPEPHTAQTSLTFLGG